jgi:hypothetical protein
MNCQKFTKVYYHCILFSGISFHNACLYSVLIYSLHYAFFVEFYRLYLFRLSEIAYADRRMQSTNIECLMPNTKAVTWVAVKLVPGLYSKSSIN